MPIGNQNARIFDVVLYQPEIAPNTGNIIRLCANTGCGLHLVRPLGFSLRDRQLRRAGLDYGDLAEVVQHASWEACRDYLAGRRQFAVTTRGEIRYDRADYAERDVFVFGSEGSGLPEAVIAQFACEQRVRVPMITASRSLNLANAVAVVVYEAWRQRAFRCGV